VAHLARLPTVKSAASIIWLKPWHIGDSLRAAPVTDTKTPLRQPLPNVVPLWADGGATRDRVQPGAVGTCRRGDADGSRAWPGLTEGAVVLESDVAGEPGRRVDWFMEAEKCRR
jgi:hypothetical protein